MKVIRISSVIVLISCLLNLQLIYGQNRPRGGEGRPAMARNGILTGTVLDAQTDTPLEYVNIALYRQRDSSLVDGSITGSKGDFRIEKLPPGRFFAKLHFIGYPVRVIDSIVLRPDNPEVNIGVIRMQLSSSSLKGVEITERRSGLEYNLDKKVINVEQNIANSGGTAVDIMRTIPAVQVDIDGNVSMRGSSNITILVDGRPSAIVSLDELPANMIERVELVTNPSARYDPEGTSGLINIVLRKQKAPGVNGQVSANIGTGDKYMTSVNLNFRKNKLNLFTAYDFRKFGHSGTSLLERTTTTRDTVSMLTQNGESNRNGYFHNVRLGADYFINPKNTLSLTTLVNWRNFSGYDVTGNLTRRDTVSTYFDRTSESNSGNNGAEATLSYKKTFDNRVQELTSDIFYSYSEGNNDNLINQYYPAGQLGSFNQHQNTRSNTYRNALTAQVDYVHPAGQGRLETGYKLSLNRNDMDYRYFNNDGLTAGWIEDATKTNHYVYEEMLNSVYGIYSNMIGEEFTYQAGVRVEQANTRSNQITQDSIYEKSYFSVFPSVHLKYEPWKDHSFQISYSRRVNRPGPRTLNPFIDYSDPLNLSAGNPTLNPEYVNALELGYYGQVKKTTLNANIFYRNTDDVVARVMTVTNDTSFTTYRNQDKAYAYGMELIVTQQIIKWWRLNANWSYFRTRFEGADLSNETKENDSWTFRANSMMQIPSIADIQISFRYNAPVVFTPSISGYRGGGGTQGKRDEEYSVDMGIKRDFFHGKGSLNIRFRDIFNTERSRVTSYGDNFVSFSERTRDSRMVFVGFTYRFNDFKRRQERERNGQDMEDFEG